MISEKEAWETFKKSGKNLRKAAKTLDIPYSTLKVKIWRIKKRLEAPTIDPATSESKKAKLTCKKNVFARYVITSAQNATPVNKDFLNSIKTYCKENDAELIIIPYRYKNPTSLWNQNNIDEDWWDSKVVPYLLDQRVKIEDVNLMIMGDVKIQPTATKPLTGFESFTDGYSAIYGHPRMQFKTVATSKKKLPKIISTTGSITEQNYTDSKAGKKGEHSHTFSALIVETNREDGVFHIRQIEAEDNGAFIDLDKRYTERRASKALPALALITGDTHAIFADEAVINSTYLNEDSIVNILKPQNLVWHDLLDFYARNHHEVNNFVKTFSKHHTGYGNVENEVKQCFELVDRCTPLFANNVVVRSNHDEALDRWIKEADFKTDPENSIFYLKTTLAILENICGNSIDPLEYWSNTFLKNRDKTRFLRRDEPFALANIELSNHGDIGPNGSRGSINGFVKAGEKIVIGHSHSPAIEGDVYQTGLSAIYNLDYARGYSSWLHTHCAIYANGKRSLINIINGKWKI